MITIRADWTLDVPEEERGIGWAGENEVERRVFVLPEGYGEDWVYRLDLRLADGSADIVLLEPEEGTLTWEITARHLDLRGAKNGYVYAQIRADKGERVKKSSVAQFRVTRSIEASGTVEINPSEIEQAEERMNALLLGAQEAEAGAESAQAAAAGSAAQAQAAQAAAESARGAAETARDEAEAAAGQTAADREAAGKDRAEVEKLAEQAAADAAQVAADKGTVAGDRLAADEAKTAAEAARDEAQRLAGELVTRYGVRFGGSANSGSTVQRLYNAVGLVAGVGTDTDEAENNFDNIYPWSDIRRCCGYWGDDGNFVVNAYKGEPGYAVDGSNGEVWVEIPLFYYKHTYTEGAEEIVISAFKLPGFMPSPINRDQGTEDAPAAKAYYPAYPMALVDDKPTSRSGVFNKIYSLNTAMTDARKAGENYTVTTTAERYAICLLMWVEFATRNMQSVMQGAVSMPYSANEVATIAETGANRIIVSTATAAKFVVGQTIGIGTSHGSTGIANNRIVTAIEDYDGSNKAICFDGDPVNVAVGNVVFTLAWVNGSCDNVIASSGSPVSNTSGKYNCMYRGIERPYGDSFEQISDVLFKREGTGTAEDPYTYDVYFLPDPTKYANGAITDDYVKLNYGIPAADGYVKTLGLDSRYPWIRIPDAIGASTTTYYSDYYYYPRSAICAARVGGSWSSGSLAGPLSWSCNYAPSNSYVGYRARLSYHR